MGMTIDEIQQGLKEYHNGFTGCAGNFQEVVDGALDIVCKYQKIEQIVADRKGKLILDTLVAIIKVVEDGNVN